MPETSEDAITSPVRGGSLTTDPNGERYTMVGMGAAWVPIEAQRLWSNIRRKRYPPDWQCWEPRPDMYVVWWRGPFDVTCSNCGSSIVELVAYRSGREFGLVMDTTSQAADPAYRRPKPGLSYWLDGHIGGRPGRASANFSCPGKACHRKYLRRNLRNLAKEMYEANLPSYSLR